MAAGDVFHISGSLKPERKAILFKGGTTDHYVQVNAAAIARVAAGDTTGSWTVWINMPYLTGTHCIIGCGDNSLVEYLELNVEAGLLTARCNVLTADQFVTQADAATHFTTHKWHHVAIVQNADGRGPVLYVDGKKIASTNDTTTDVDAWFGATTAIDTMRIGGANKAGDASVGNDFQGGISDVKIFTDALTDAEVLDDYNGISNTNNLHNHYDFDGDLIDAGTGADNGTLTGSAATFCPNYSQFSSRLLTITTPLVADDFAFSTYNDRADLLVFKAA